MTMMTKRRLAPAMFTLAVMFSLGSMAVADPARYAVRANAAAREDGAPPEYRADNPANKLRLAFPVTGLIGSPELAGAKGWSFEFRLAAISFDGQLIPVDSARLSASGDRVDYDFGAARVSYLNQPSGLNQLITIAEPAVRGKAGAPTVLGLELTIDGDLEPTQDGYFIKMTATTAKSRCVTVRSRRTTPTGNASMPGSIWLSTAKGTSPAFG